MPFEVPDDTQAEEAWPRGGYGHFIYVPSAWRTGQSRIDAPAGTGAEIEEALQDLHAIYLDLPIPDRLLDLVRRKHG